LPYDYMMSGKKLLFPINIISLDPKLSKQDFTILVCQIVKLYILYLLHTALWCIATTPDE
jgi:hypothetical protein